jgi:hypothetical protein
MAKLLDITDQCNSRADQYGQLMQDYRRQYVQNSEQHATTLENEAKRLQRLQLFDCDEEI